MTRERSVELKELLEVLDIETFLDTQGIEYRSTMGSRGRQLNVKECPVCGSTHWKVYLSAETGLGNCFAGSHPPGKNFNKFAFVRASMGEGTPVKAVLDLLRRSARDYGWRAKRTIAAATQAARTSPTLPPHLTLPIAGRNLAYLENRGIDLVTAKYFDLRYCHAGSSFEYVLPENGPRKQDYSYRVLIPIYDLDGTLVSFQGRDITGEAERKYLFPPGYASTGEFLYNGHNVMATKRIVVGEGAFDVMAIKLALDQDINLRDVVPVGTFGKHLSFGSPQSQLEKFRKLKDERGVEQVTLMWDGEIRATDDALKAAELLRGIGLRVSIAMLPPDKDPNEVAPQVVRDAYYRAIPVNPVSSVSVALKRRQMNAANGPTA